MTEENRRLYFGIVKNQPCVVVPKVIIKEMILDLQERFEKIEKWKWIKDRTPNLDEEPMGEASKY